MILRRTHLTVLLNALYETDRRTVSVAHPCAEMGELLRVELGDPFASTVEFTRSLSAYETARAEVGHAYATEAYEDLPDDSTYARLLVASGVLDVANRGAVDEFVERHGFRDLEAGHAPLVAGIDANVLPWELGRVLDVDHRTGTRDDAGRAPTNGYALATGVKEELDWHYKQHRTPSLVDAFGEAFGRLDNQPAGANREGFLGLYEYRRLMADRTVDVVDTGTGDAAIVEGYAAYADASRKEPALFSNDFGFVERAIDAGLLAQHVDFPRRIPESTTASWEAVADLLYFAAIRFGVVSLPGVTLYGVWNGKDGRHWQQEALVVEPRSPTLEPILKRDRTIVEAYDAQR